VGVSANANGNGNGNANLREETAIRVYWETGREERTRTNANAKCNLTATRGTALRLTTYDLRLTTYDLRNIL
jgi:hypothetical protein